MYGYFANKNKHSLIIKNIHKNMAIYLKNRKINERISAPESKTKSRDWKVNWPKICEILAPHILNYYVAKSCCDIVTLSFVCGFDTKIKEEE